MRGMRVGIGGKCLFLTGVSVVVCHWGAQMLLAVLKLIS